MNSINRNSNSNDNDNNNYDTRNNITNASIVESHTSDCLQTCIQASHDHHNNIEVEDLLPSFQMHNFMFNRVLTGPNYNGISPPDYDSISSESGVKPIVISGGTEIDPNAEMELDAVYDAGQPTNLVLNNLDRLENINAPVKVIITLTEQLVTFGSNYIKRNPLREFTPGDMVYGFVTFENLSNVDIPFEILLVSMECKIGTTDYELGKRFSTTIMKTYDLQACYNFESGGDNVKKRYPYDPKDDTFIGFRRRLIQPGMKIKKFFKFKIPDRLLDSACEHQLSDHLNPPPSYGLNRQAANSAAETVILDDSFGYSKSALSGAPLHVKDFAGSEFCNYFVNVQIIGRGMEVYQQFRRRPSQTNDNYLLIKCREHYFRVGRSTLLLYDSHQFVKTRTSTQLNNLRNIAVDTLEVLTEREMLQNSGVSDSEDQDEMIYSGREKGKTTLAYLNCIDNGNMAVSNLQSYTATLSFTFKKTLFSTLAGEVNAELKFSKTSVLQSYLPKDMDLLKEESVFRGDLTKTYKPNIAIHLTFNPSLEGKAKCPKMVTITPQLIMCHLNSPTGLPITVDNEYLCDDPGNIKHRLEQHKLYYNEICKLKKRVQASILPEVESQLEGIANCRYHENPLETPLKSQNIELDSKWVYDAKAKSYVADIEIPVEVDTAALECNPHALLPNFQTCMFARLYKVAVDVKFAKGLEGSASFPINII
jgi:hypothetical protein